MLNLKLIIGSKRPGRASDRVTSWIVPVTRTLPPAAMRLMAMPEEAAT